MKNLVSVLFSFLFIACAGTKQKDNNELSSFKENNIEEAGSLITNIVKKYMESPHKPPGLSVAISQNGHMVYARGFGYSDMESKEKVTIHTKFRAASVSKMMTATAIAKLMQEDLLDIHASVQKYVPDFPVKLYSINTKLIAGHISGMPHYSSGDLMKNHFYTSISESLKVFSHHDLLFEPGTKYNYSTHGYTLLTGVIEGASGLPFLEYLDKEIFKPLKMLSTGPDLGKDKVENMTQLYDRDQSNNISKILYPENTSYKWGAGGMVSTPTDLVKLGDAYMNGFFKPEIVEEMFKVQKLNSGEETGVGIGWRRNWDLQGNETFDHAGWMGGARSVISIFPEQKLSVAIMCNITRPNQIEEMAHILAVPFNKNSSPEKQPTGKAEIAIIKKLNNKEISENGFLYLNGTDDKVIIRNKNGEENLYSLIYLQEDGLYGMITEDGILFTTIHVKGDTVSGKVIRYARSPQLIKPSFENAFITFEGDFVHE